MKSLVVFMRIIIIGCLWGIVFTEGIRVIMLCNWHFDIFWPEHWRQAWTLWNAGWVVRAPKEWAFILLIITFIPMLITGWWTLSLVSWESLIWKILMLPVVLYRKLVKTPVNLITTSNKYGVVKRKSYKQIRPAGVNSIRTPISDYSDALSSSTPYPSIGASSYTAKPIENKKTTDVSAAIDHALFKFDTDDDDFDLDIDSFEKADVKKTEVSKKDKSSENDEFSKKVSKFDFDDEQDVDIFDNTKAKNKSKNYNDSTRREKKNSSKDTDERSDKNKRSKGNDVENSGRTDSVSRGPVFDTLVQKGYSVISNVSIGANSVDYIGVSEDEICLCIVDKEAGDWLADEEMFNGEEPLWFSESSHRISPVRKLNLIKDLLTNKLEEEGFGQKVSSFVVIQMANIINADDMFDIWAEMDINVTRINRGSPKEIRLFSKVLNEAGAPMPKKDLDRLRKVLKNL